MVIAPPTTYVLFVQTLLVLNEGNGWVAGGCWDDYSLVIMDHSLKFPAFSTSKKLMMNIDCHHDQHHGEHGVFHGFPFWKEIW